VLEALADPTRRAVFEMVAAAPASVTAIAERLPVSRPAVSQHLQVLRRARLVHATPSGTQRIYRLDSEGVRAVQGYFDQFWSDALDRFTEAADRESRSGRTTARRAKPTKEQP
jgi:DNA-binding transcriptional ArsR family regulator